MVLTYVVGDAEGGDTRKSTDCAGRTARLKIDSGTSYCTRTHPSHSPWAIGPAVCISVEPYGVSGGGGWEILPPVERKAAGSWHSRGELSRLVGVDRANGIFTVGRSSWKSRDKRSHRSTDVFPVNGWKQVLLRMHHPLQNR